jgi:hypothetical protein
MELTLMDLKRYAIDNRSEIRFSDPLSGRNCMINILGQVKILDDDKDLRIEDTLAAAEAFEVVESGKQARFTREAMAEAINESFKRRGFAASVKEEE